MMRKRSQGRSLLSGAIALAFYGSVSATPIDTSRIDNLRSILDSITPVGHSSVSANGNQVEDNIWWSITGTGSANSTLIAEISPGGEYNALGVYDASDPSRQVLLFGASNGRGDGATLTLRDPDESGGHFDVYVNGTDSGVDFANNLFGFFLETSAGTWFSDPTLNTDSASHLVVFQGNDSDVVRLPFRPTGIWTDNEFILAWDNSFHPGIGFYGYNDFVTMAESIVPVPEPSSILLLGSGLAFASLLATRRRRPR